jgi:hypothetical protein
MDIKVRRRKNVSLDVDVVHSIIIFFHIYPHCRVFPPNLQLESLHQRRTCEKGEEERESLSQCDISMERKVLLIHLKRAGIVENKEQIDPKPGSSHREGLKQPPHPSFSLSLSLPSLG